MLTIWHFVRCFALYLYYNFISFADGRPVLFHLLSRTTLSLRLSAARAFVLARVLNAAAAAAILPALALQQWQQYLNLYFF